MSDFDLKDILEKLTAKIAADLKNTGDEGAVVNITMNRAPVSCTKLNFEPVNKLEQISLNALICWVAANCNISEAQVAARLTQTFGTETVDGIDRDDFDKAIEWLVDFEPILH